MSRTLVKSPPELWDELRAEGLSPVADGLSVQPTDPPRALAWRAAGMHGTAVLEPSSWGTKVTLTAEVEDRVASGGLWSALRGDQVASAVPDDLEERLSSVLDELGSAHKKPFTAG